MIELIRVTKQFRNGRGIEDITLRLDKGEWVAVVGPAGAGKTTLLRSVYAAMVPDSGEVIVGDYRLSSMKSSDYPRLRQLMGIVDQDLALLKDRNALQNATFVGDILGWSAKRSKNAALKALNSVGLYNHLESFPHQLSYGEQRRLAIARALMAEPFALVIDEPLGHLDPDTAAEIVELLATIHQHGTSILMTTHRIDFFKDKPVRTVRIERGRMVEA